MFQHVFFFSVGQTIVKHYKKASWQLQKALIEIAKLPTPESSSDSSLTQPISGNEDIDDDDNTKIQRENAVLLKFDIECLR